VEKRNGSWFALFTFCFAGVLAVSLAIGTILAGIALGFGFTESLQAATTRAADLPARGTFAGLITDSYCGARHAKDSGKTSEECARACVRRGARYTLVNGDTSYTLMGNPAILEKMAGQRVRVEGALQGDAVRVSSITSAP
jgi:hypothetical protein